MMLQQRLVYAGVGLNDHVGQVWQGLADPGRGVTSFYIETEYPFTQC